MNGIVAIPTLAFISIIEIAPVCGVDLDGDRSMDLITVAPEVVLRVNIAARQEQQLSPPDTRPRPVICHDTC
jgi:hypothetical protein